MACAIDRNDLDASSFIVLDAACKDLFAGKFMELDHVEAERGRVRLSLWLYYHFFPYVAPRRNLSADSGPEHGQ